MNNVIINKTKVLLRYTLVILSDYSNLLRPFGYIALKACFI